MYNVRMKNYGLVLISLFLGSFSIASDSETMKQKNFIVGRHVISDWIAEVKEAKKTIHVATYKLTSKVAFDALAAAHNRGIEVRIVLDGAEAKSRKSLAQEAIRAGMEVVFWPSNYQGELHTKFYIFDDMCVILGSFNLSESAAGKNVEILYKIENKEIVKGFTDEWQKLYDQSLPVNPTNIDE